MQGYMAEDILYIGIRTAAKSTPTPSAKATIIIGSIRVTRVSTVFFISLA